MNHNAKPSTLPSWCHGDCKCKRNQRSTLSSCLLLFLFCSSRIGHCTGTLHSKVISSALMTALGVPDAASAAPDQTETNTPVQGDPKKNAGGLVQRKLPPFVEYERPLSINCPNGLSSHLLQHFISQQGGRFKED